MTAMGKLLVFLVLVLTLVWNGLVVNAYVTRTNWRAEAKESLKKAKESADAATAMENLLKAERIASADENRALREERDRLYNQVTTMTAANKDLLDKYGEVAKAAEASGRDNATFQANIAKLQTQVDNQDKLLTSKEKEVNDQTVAANEAKVIANKATLGEAAQAQRAERLGNQLQDLIEKFEDYKRQLGKPGSSILGKVPAIPEGFRASVTRFKDNLVELNAGLDAGLRQGAVLTVSRRTGGGIYIGKVTITTVDTKQAVGQFTGPTGKRMSAADYPQPGDELTPDVK